MADLPMRPACMSNNRETPGCVIVEAVVSCCYYHQHPTTNHIAAAAAATVAAQVNGYDSQPDVRCSRLHTWTLSGCIGPEARGCPALHERDVQESTFQLGL